MAERSPPVERLAAALQDCISPPGREERVARLADALQDCLDTAATAAATAAAKAAVAEMEPRFEAMEARMDTRLDKQDATLRMFWKQMGGNGRLPIDD